MQPQDQYRVWAEIDLRALKKNYETAQACAGSAQVMPVIKADAYGHGAVMAARTLSGAQWFGVATAEEAFELRQGGIDAQILLLSPAPAGRVAELCEADVTLCVPSLETARRYAAALPHRSPPLRVHVKLDTGMSRLGLLPENAVRELLEIQKMPQMQISGLMTHFACADEPGNGLTAAQIRRFEDCRRALSQARVHIPFCHCANSAAVLSNPASRYDMVRAGIMLYGTNPIAGDATALLPVMTLKTSIVHVTRIPKGQGVSYGHTWRAGRDSVIATVPAGYADGLSRRLSGRVSMLVRGREAPQVGRICMDMCMLDVTGIPDAALGDTVTIIGRDGDAAVRAEDHAALLETIPYEIFCAVGKRVPRVYRQLTVDN